MNKNRRLAVIDTWFPWKLSGFRYWENVEIHVQRPDTLFFAAFLRSDEFPAPVLPFAQFQSVALAEKITDVYCVFLNLTLSLLGACTLPDGSRIAGGDETMNIRPFLSHHKIDLHSTIYPGGGLDLGTKPEFLSIAASGCKTIFTNNTEVLTKISSSIYQPVAINTDLYHVVPKQWSRPIQLIFCAFNYPRKGFPLLAEVFNRLNADFHLHIVGDWDDHLHLLTNQRFTFHGPLSPDSLTALYQQSHVFINLSSSDGLALDGFPTTAALDAMAAGCLLISINPRNDHLVLASGNDYLEVSPEAQTVVDALHWVRDHMPEARQLAVNGANTVKTRFNVSEIVKAKLYYMLDRY
ncbi:glycosyltransferase family protein [Paenibacillus elgii]|uniref:glycosyltransferase family protein n=1 Tax=Paenibacillus elgii TaxID=189691 RepID=UPI00203AAD39|nr:glycosyltransferase [Paenibacillus elgii]MCM3270695.1 glycosyltransferase [Paenibacillus elgii]